MCTGTVHTYIRTCMYVANYLLLIYQYTAGQLAILIINGQYDKAVE